MKVYSNSKCDETNIIDYLKLIFRIYIFKSSANHRQFISTEHYWMWDYRVVHAYTQKYLQLFFILQSRNITLQHILISLFRIHMPVLTYCKMIYITDYLRPETLWKIVVVILYYQEYLLQVILDQKRAAFLINSKAQVDRSPRKNIFLHCVFGQNKKPFCQCVSGNYVFAIVNSVDRWKRRSVADWGGKRSEAGSEGEGEMETAVI